MKDWIYKNKNVTPFNDCFYSLETNTEAQPTVLIFLYVLFSLQAFFTKKSILK